MYTTELSWYHMRRIVAYGYQDQKDLQHSGSNKHNGTACQHTSINVSNAIFRRHRDRSHNVKQLWKYYAITNSTIWDFKAYKFDVQINYELFALSEIISNAHYQHSFNQSIMFRNVETDSPSDFQIHNRTESNQPRWL